MSDARPRVVVVGSCNLDQVISGRTFPAGGLTVHADALIEDAGGKGLNQAVAAARMGASVSFIGAVGSDSAGDLILSTLNGAGIDTSQVRQRKGTSGRALIFVDATGENRIVLLRGANATVERLHDQDRERIRQADCLLLQLELPMSVVVEAAAVAASAGVSVALTPAPTQPLPPELLAATSVLILNQHEALQLTGTESLDDAILELLRLVPELVVTQGGAGSTYADRSGARVARPAAQARVVDTTAAGDTYAGIFAVTRAAGIPPAEAMSVASAAAAIAVESTGTSRSIPLRAAVLARARIG